MHQGNNPRAALHRTVIGFQVISGVDERNAFLFNRFAFHIFRHHSLMFWNNGIRQIESADLRPVDVSSFIVSVRRTDNFP